jgi:subtilisin family serine protease
MWAAQSRDNNGAQPLDLKLPVRNFSAEVEPETLEYMPNELLVKFNHSKAFTLNAGALHFASGDLARTAECFGLATASEVVPGTIKLSGTRVDVVAAAQALQATEDVQYAVPNYIRHVTIAPNDQQYVGLQQWGVTQIKAEQAWDTTTGASDMVIAVVDTGTAPNHPDLEDKIVAGWDFVNNDGDPSDDFGHGTYTAGIAAASSNNDRGITGISWGARIMPIKVLSSRGSGTDANIARGIHWAVDHGAKIINASLGGDQNSPVGREAAQYAYDHNVLFVASAGNTPDGRPNYPAGYDTVLAVGATGRADTYTGFSSFGGYVGVSAPGVGILSTGWDHGNLDYEYGNGTSASAPFVSGLAALVWSANPSLTAQDVRTIIEDSSDDLGDIGRDQHYGFGRVNAQRAVLMALQGARPSHTPTPVVEATATAGGARPTATKGPANTAIQVSSTNVAPGALLSVSGAGFGPNEIVDLELAGADGNPNSIGNVTTGPGGDFRAEVTLPPLLPTGKMTLTAVGSTSGKRASVELTVSSAGGNGGQSSVHGIVKGGVVTGATVVMQPTLGYTGQTLTTQVGPDFGYSFNGVAEGIYALSASAQGFLPAGPFIVQVNGTAQDNKAIDVTLNASRPAAFGRVPAVPNSPTQVYFDAVGHTLKGPFLNFWRQRGGLAVFGYPLSEEFSELSATDGKLYTVQYFERNRFEYHPEFAGTPNEVLMGLLGVDSTKGRTFPAGQPIAGDPGRTTFFKETQHSLSGPFLAYWKAKGGLAVFGYPISEPVSENGYVVQYFERNRFELHTEYAGTPNEVLLGLLGVETIRRNGWLNAP